MEYLCHKWQRICSTCRKHFPHSWLITGRVTRLTRPVPLVEQEVLTLPEHPSSPSVLSGVRVSRSLVLCVCFVDRCLSFVLFLFAIVLSVLRYTDSDYPSGIFKLFWNTFYLYHWGSISIQHKWSSKLPKGKSESVHPEAYNTMLKEIRTVTIFKNSRRHHLLCKLPSIHFHIFTQYTKNLINYEGYLNIEAFDSFGLS